MSMQEIVRVPVDRVGVIIGHNGRVKKRIEKLTNVQLEITAEGVVSITGSPDPEDPILIWKARDIVRAIGRGFSPHNALSLIDEDARLLVISLRELVGTSPSQIRRVAGRIIGEHGRTRRVIEEITDTKISIYGRTVSLIGSDPGLDYAQRAVQMLIDGAPHNAVYRYLERMRREINRMRLELWDSDVQ